QTMVTPRIGKDTGEPGAPTAADQINSTAVMDNGAVAEVLLSSAARQTTGNQVQIFGSNGTLMLSNNDERLLYAKPGEEAVDISESDPNADLPGVGKGIWNVSFVALIKELTDSIREGRQ